MAIVEIDRRATLAPRRNRCRASTRSARALRCLPGVGPKAAQRMALHLMQHDRDGARALGRALQHAADDRSATASAAIRSPRTPICALCRSPQRDPALLCVVETPADLLMVEHDAGVSRACTSC